MCVFARSGAASEKPNRQQQQRQRAPRAPLARSLDRSSVRRLSGTSARLLRAYVSSTARQVRRALTRLDAIKAAPTHSLFVARAHAPWSSTAVATARSATRHSHTHTYIAREASRDQNDGLDASAAHVRAHGEGAGSVLQPGRRRARADQEQRGANVGDHCICGSYTLLAALAAAFSAVGVVRTHALALGVAAVDPHDLVFGRVAHVLTISLRVCMYGSLDDRTRARAATP